MLRFYYRNYKGETSLRSVVPEKIWFGTTEYHLLGCWLLRAFDLDRNAVRDFDMAAMKGVQHAKD